MPRVRWPGACVWARLYLTLLSSRLSHPADRPADALSSPAATPRCVFHILVARAAVPVPIKLPRPLGLVRAFPGRRASVALLVDSLHRAVMLRSDIPPTPRRRADRQRTASPSSGQHGPSSRCIPVPGRRSRHSLQHGHIPRHPSIPLHLSMRPRRQPIPSPSPSCGRPRSPGLGLTRFSNSSSLPGRSFAAGAPISCMACSTASRNIWSSSARWRRSV